MSVYHVLWNTSVPEYVSVMQHYKELMFPKVFAGIVSGELASPPPVTRSVACSPLSVSFTTLQIRSTAVKPRVWGNEMLAVNLSFTVIK